MTAREIALMRTRAALLIAANMDADPESRSRSRAEVERIDKAIALERERPERSDPDGNRELAAAYRNFAALFAKIFGPEEEQSPAVVWEPSKKGDA